MKDSEKIFTTCYTVLECKSCSKSITRKFNDGDIVFQKIGDCDDCKGVLLIWKIFGETIGP